VLLDDFVGLAFGLGVVLAALFLIRLARLRGFALDPLVLVALFLDAGFFSSIFDWFLSPAGVLLLAALDASIVFFLPAALDMVVILVSARGEHGYILTPLLAAAGSGVGKGALAGAVAGEAYTWTGLQCEWDPVL
jgi:hypothetical protein